MPLCGSRCASWHPLKWGVCKCRPTPVASVQPFSSLLEHPHLSLHLSARWHRRKAVKIHSQVLSGVPDRGRRITSPRVLVNNTECAQQEEVGGQAKRLG